MQNFIYNTPTKVVFGRGAEQQTGALVKEQGCKKVLVHYGGESAKRSGLLNAILASLEAAGVDHVDLGGVKPNPRLSFVREGIELCKKEGVDFLLAVGGGSVIDSAKAIAYGCAYDGDVWDLFCGTAPQAALPVGAVLTIAAAGSEMSNSCVITNDELQTKRGLNTELGRCRFAVMNPELTMTLPPYQTAVGCADILMHTMERYFTFEKTMETTDGIAESLMRTVIANAVQLTREPDDYNARAEIMWCSSLSHNGLTGCGSGAGDWACHQLGHEISAMFDLAHGASLTVVWGSWARYVYKRALERFARFAEQVMALPPLEDLEEMALAGIEEVEGFFWSLELPTKVNEAGIELTDELVAELAKRCSRGGTRTIGSVMELGEKEMADIYGMAR